MLLYYNNYYLNIYLINFDIHVGEGCDTTICTINLFLPLYGTFVLA